jgi:hypothetical protein
LGRLELRGTAITDGSVEYLAKLQRLEQLDVAGTKISESAVAQLREIFPEAQIKK